MRAGPDSSATCSVIRSVRGGAGGGGSVSGAAGSDGVLGVVGRIDRSTGAAMATCEPSGAAGTVGEPGVPGAANGIGAAAWDSAATEDAETGPFAPRAARPPVALELLEPVPESEPELDEP